MLKLRDVSLYQLKRCYRHPSIFLFRAIELQTIFNLCSDYQFNQPALDLGCGDGLISNLLFNDRFDFGLDNGEANDIDVAIELGRYKKILIESAEKISIPDGSLEFVFSNCVLEHIPPIETVLSEVSRCLMKGGKFLFTVPSDRFGEFLYLTHKFRCLGFGHMGDIYSEKRNKMLNHYHCYNHDVWMGMLSKAGMKIEVFQYYMSSSALKLWDKIALEIFAGKMFGFDSRNRVHMKYTDSIKMMVEDDNCKVGDGAAIAIVATRK